jgi:hypothetical protein
VLKDRGSLAFSTSISFSFIKAGMILLPTVAAVASLASNMIATDLMLKLFL